MNGWFKFIALAGAAFAAACEPVTMKYPIGTTVGMAPDPALHGTWNAYQDEKKTPGYFVHFLDGDHGDMTAVWIAASLDRKDDGVALFGVTTATLGANHLMNWVPSNATCVGVLKCAVTRQPEAKGPIPVLYRFTNPSQVVLLSMDDDATAAAIEAGAVAGTVEKREAKDEKGHVWWTYKVVQITAEPAALDAFMAKPEAAKLFRPFLVLEKIE